MKKKENIEKSKAGKSQSSIKQETVVDDSGMLNSALLISRLLMFIGLAVFFMPFLMDGTNRIANIIVSGMIGSMIFYGGFNFYKASQVLKMLDNFFILKNRIFSERLQLSDLINNDINNLGINIPELIIYKKIIGSISEGYKLILGCHEYVRDNARYIGNIPKKERKTMKSELQWIVDYSQEFTLLVQSWISHHATELAELEKQIECQEVSTESSGGKATLGLQRLSLQEHLKELEKVRV